MSVSILRWKNAWTETSRQTGLLYGAQLTGTALNALVHIILANWMGEAGYGIFSFCLVSVIQFIGYFFEFGAFSAGARLLAVQKDREEERRVFGALLVTGLLIGACLAAFIALFSLFGGVIFKHSQVPWSQARWILLIASGLSLAVPLQLLIELSCQGTNRISLFSFFQASLPAWGLLAIGFAMRFHALTPLPALLAYLSGILLACLAIIRILRPSVKNLGANVRMILSETRKYGWDIYIGRVTTMVSSRLDGLLIPYFAGTVAFGSYAVAQRISQPILGLARSIAISRFRTFANVRSISPKIINWNLFLLASMSIGFVFIGPYAIRLLLPGKFEAAIPLILPFAMINFFNGLFQPYNSFLYAHGRGSELRNISVIVGATSLVGNLIFIPRYGIRGAAWVGVIAMSIDYLFHLHSYRKVKRRLGDRPLTQADAVVAEELIG